VHVCVHIQREYLLNLIKITRYTNSTFLEENVVVDHRNINSFRLEKTLKIMKPNVTNALYFICAN